MVFEYILQRTRFLTNNKGITRIVSSIEIPSCLAVHLSFADGRVPAEARGKLCVHTLGILHIDLCNCAFVAQRRADSRTAAESAHRQLSASSSTRQVEILILRLSTRLLQGVKCRWTGIVVVREHCGFVRAATEPWHRAQSSANLRQPASIQLTATKKGMGPLSILDQGLAESSLVDCSSGPLIKWQWTESSQVWKGK